MRTALRYLTILAVGCNTSLSAGGSQNPGGGSAGAADAADAADGGAATDARAPSGTDDNDPRIDAEPCDQVSPIEYTDPKAPDLLLVVDKSGSMVEWLESGQLKWLVMRDALNAVVAEYERRINFGLTLYPTGGDCAEGSVVSDLQPGAAEAISLALTWIIPSGGTPTHTTMRGARDYFLTVPTNPNGRYALLATDGQPNCVDSGDPNVSGISESITAIQDLRSAGIPTYVLGFGSTINNDPETLQAMAEAGGTGRFFAANSTAELLAALDAIADEVSVPPCVLELGAVPDYPELITVSFDGVPVPRTSAHTNGWDYDPATNTVTFYGSACDQVQTGQVESVEIDYGCGGPIVD